MTAVDLGFGVLGGVIFLAAAYLVLRLFLWLLRLAGVWRRFRAWLRRNIVVQVLAVEPGDVLVVNFQPGTYISPVQMAEAQTAITRTLQAVHAKPGAAPCQVIVGKGIDVSVVRQIYGSALPDRGL